MDLTSVVSNPTTTSTSSNEANLHTSGAGLYKIVDETVSIKIFDQPLEFTYPKATATSPINIKKDFPWCNSATNKTEVPSIYAKEFELTWGQTMTNLQRFVQGSAQIASGKFTDPYLTMYSAKPTGFNYCFPHLLKGASSLRDIRNSWNNKDDFSIPDKIIGAIGGALGANDMVETAKDIVGGVLPGSGLEKTEKFQETASQTVTVSFPLYNTKDVKTAFKNYCFCLLFAFQNLKTRTTFMTYIPPKLYTLSNPYGGGIYMPVAIVDSYNVESIGTTRVLSDHMSDGLTNAPILIPEAYKVTIVFREIVTPSANILLGAMGGKQISVMDNAAYSDIVGGVTTAGIAIGNAANGFVNTIVSGKGLVNLMGNIGGLNIPLVSPAASNAADFYEQQRLTLTPSTPTK